MSYIARQSRTQLTVVLAGRGYVGRGASVVTLRPGDAVLLDQRLHDDEGYAGSPCEVLCVEWDTSAPVDVLCEGPPRLGRLSVRETERLRALTARMGHEPGEAWTLELLRQLRSAGLPAPRTGSLGASIGAPTAAVYRGLGEARERLHAQPSLDELATEVGISERHARRAIESLSNEYGMVIEGWRDALADMRMSAAQQLLSIPGMPVHRVAALTGFRSSIALAHAFSSRSTTTPGGLARALHERWG
ncbi:MAG: hypothetical protein U0234_33495 [Sandaracinus sp.]